MRQNTCLTALGMFCAGFSDSPAAMPISSVPWKEKPAIMATPMTAARPPTKGPSPEVKLSRPTGVWPFITPKIMVRPVMMKMMTVITLISANQYSLSPKPRTEIALRANIRKRKRPLQRTPGTSGNQYCMTRLAATSSTAMVTAQLYQ